jgi:hypothetical protein
MSMTTTTVIGLLAATLLSVPVIACGGDGDPEPFADGGASASSSSGDGTGAGDGSTAGSGGDPTTSGSGGAGASTGNGGDASGGAATTGGGGDASTGSGMTGPCAADCAALFDCTQEPANGSTLCPGFTPADEALFIDNCVANPQCGQIGALLGLGCATAISTLSSFDATFAMGCAGN